MPRPTRKSVTPAPGRWVDDAVCWRFPRLAGAFINAQDFETADPALTICLDCPVRAQCLAFGQSLQADGVWGGRLLRDGRIQRRLPWRDHPGTAGDAGDG